MNNLRELQECFQDHLLHQGDRIVDRIISTKKASAATRLAIYSEAYRLRLLEALKKDYPALNKLMGDEQFEELGRAYIEAYPSRSRSVRWFGATMPKYLRSTATYESQHILTEMAAFEWTLAEVFDAEDSIVVAAEQVAAIPPERWPEMRLMLHPTLRRLNLQWNVVPIWKAIKKNDAPDPPQAAESPLAWLIWRKEMETLFRSLEGDEAWAIDAVIDRATFGSICVGLCRWVGDDRAATRAASLLKGWVTTGLITRIDLSP